MAVAEAQVLHNYCPQHLSMGTTIMKLKSAKEAEVESEEGEYRKSLNIKSLNINKFDWHINITAQDGDTYK